METEKYLLEEWRDIRGYEGLYQVSNFGRVRSLDKISRNRWGEYLLKGCVLAPLVGTKGYLLVRLYKNGSAKTLKIHRLVAEAFIPNPNNLPQVNHKDENKQNNVVSNLEWCDNFYNSRYGTRNQKIGEYFRNGPTSKPVSMYSIGGTLLKTFPSCSEAARELGLYQACISSCCRGDKKTYKGVVWRFA